MNEFKPIAIGFEAYLLKQGYTPYSKRYRNGKFEYEEPPMQLSTMGDIDIRYLKDDIEFIIGLHEKDKPPTLISPRPSSCKNDDTMNKLLSHFSHEEIYNACLNQSINLILPE